MGMHGFLGFFVLSGQGHRSSNDTAPISIRIVSASHLHRRGPALHKLNHENNNRDNQQEMYEASHGIGSDKSQEPQHYQDHKYRPEHVRLLSSTCAGSVECRHIHLSTLVTFHAYCRTFGSWPLFV